MTDIVKGGKFGPNSGCLLLNCSRVVFGTPSRGEAYCGGLTKQINDLVLIVPCPGSRAATSARDFAADSLQMQQTARNYHNLWLHTEEGRPNKKSASRPCYQSIREGHTDARKVVDGREAWGLRTFLQRCRPFHATIGAAMGWLGRPTPSKRCKPL